MSKHSSLNRSDLNRRDFLKTSSALAAGGMFYFGAEPAALAFKAPSERPRIGCIGTGDRWKQIVGGAMNFGDVLAVCDVDADHMGEGRDIVKKAQKRDQIDMQTDYRKILDRKDIDVVTIVTPDHWHSKIAIEAMLAGKDIYCEKPLTLTIEEGKQIVKVLKQTKRVFQVGTQQRSEMGSRFLTAIAMVRDGRIGELKKAQCAIGPAPKGGPFKKTEAPKNLNWDMWLGQAPKVDYIKERCHYEFRWWYEYSGGKMTDWGAHHVDIAQWALGMENSGPTSVEGTAVHPCEYKDGYPVKDDVYNTATDFLINCKFAGGKELVIRHDTENGVTLEGTKGTIFVSRGALTGEAVDELKKKPLPGDALSKLYKGKKPGNHMQNFFECVTSREDPISDVYTHHRAMTTCHLANIAIRLGRKIEWNPKSENMVGDDQARAWQAREQRKGYEIKV